LRPDDAAPDDAALDDAALDDAALDGAALDGAALDERFIALETKVAYQDKLIAELNEVIVEQTRELTLLTKRLEHLERYVRDPEEDTAPPANERPPHY